MCTILFFSLGKPQIYFLLSKKEKGDISRVLKNCAAGIFVFVQLIFTASKKCPTYKQLHIIKPNYTTFYQHF